MNMGPTRFSRRQVLQGGATGLAATAVAGTRFGASAKQQATPIASQGATAESVAAAIPQLEGIIQESMTSTGVPGVAVAVVFQDEVVHLGGYGVREAGKNEPVDADTVFQLASISKSISSTAVAAVVGDGVVSWDSRVSKLLPDFALSDHWVTGEVTIRDCFSHRTGLPAFAGDDLEDLGYDRDEILHRLRFLPSASSFRSAYAYTNFVLTAGAAAAAAAAETPWEDLIATRLYQPLGMTSTSSRFDDFMARSNRARGHVLVDGAYVAKYQREPQAQAPAGGVSSNVRDLAQWVRLLLGRGTIDGAEIVNAEALSEAHRPHMATSHPENPETSRTGFYGLGWNVSYDARGRVRLSHSGAFLQGAGTTVALLPAEQLGIVVLTNAQPIGLAEAISLSFIDLADTGRIAADYLDVVGGVIAAQLAPTYGTAVDYSTPPADAEPVLNLSVYTGVFANDYFGKATVEVEGEGLVLRLGPDQSPYPMRHFDCDVFTYQPVGENSFGESAVTFAIGPDDRAVCVLIENLDLNRLGTFSRVP
jgi:CubicO group peptidase (beta-lactamase class C family)